MTDKINIHDPTNWVSPPGFGIAGLVVPERSDWTMHAAGTQFTPLKGQEPNAFHRMMQRLVLGIRWERTKRPVGGIDCGPSPYWRNAGQDER